MSVLMVKGGLFPSEKERKQGKFPFEKEIIG